MCVRVCMHASLCVCAFKSTLISLFMNEGNRFGCNYWPACQRPRWPLLRRPLRRCQNDRSCQACHPVYLKGKKKDWIDWKRLTARMQAVKHCLDHKLLFSILKMCRHSRQNVHLKTLEKCLQRESLEKESRMLIGDLLSIPLSVNQPEFSMAVEPVRVGSVAVTQSSSVSLPHNPMHCWVVNTTLAKVSRESGENISPTRKRL